MTDGDESMRAASLMAEAMDQLFANAAAELNTDSTPAETRAEEEQDQDQEQEEEGGGAEAAATAAETEAGVVRTYLQRYSGHRSSDTIKGCAFCGPSSEFVVSGSDDWRIFIWERDTGTLLRVLNGHEGVVNCIVQHPHDTLLASSGIDDYIMLWDCSGEPPSEDVRAAREHEIERVRAMNSQSVLNMAAGQACTQQ